MAVTITKDMLIGDVLDMDIGCAEYFFEMSSNEHAIYIDHKHGLTGIFGSILKSTPSQVMESNEDSQRSNIEKYILTQYQTMNELYGE